MHIHPLHPASVHIPLTCMLATPVADVAATLLHRDDLWLFSAVTAVAALGFGLVAATFGALDFEKAHAKAPRTVIWHASAMAAALLLEAVSLAGRVTSEGGLVSPPEAFALLASGAAFLIVLAGAYLGGDLVYHHGINVDPEQKP